jgi:hypothetical protein
MNYQIMCEVMGGITGYRRGVLRNGGCPCLFSTKSKAEAEADRLMTINNHPHTRATYRYTAEAVS